MRSFIVAMVVGLLDGCSVAPATPPPGMDLQNRWLERCMHGLSQVRDVAIVQYRAEGDLQWGNGAALAGKHQNDLVLTCHQPHEIRHFKANGGWFVGYGRMAPALGLDDYGGQDVRGQLVVLLGGDAPGLEPSWVDSRKALESDGRYVGQTQQTRLHLALQRGAALVMMVVPEEQWREHRRFPAGLAVEEGDHQEDGLVVWIGEANWQHLRASLDGDWKRQAEQKDFRPVFWKQSLTAQWTCETRHGHLAVPALWGMDR